MRMKAPCKDCLDRKENCHAKCAKYLLYVAENKRIKQERAEAAMIDALVIDTAAKRKKRYGGRK